MHHFDDAHECPSFISGTCRSDKERENAAALEVFHDLLKELDALSSEGRLLALIQGSLAANIFDWGARACVELYHQGTILEIYRCISEISNNNRSPKRTSTAFASLTCLTSLPAIVDLMSLDNVPQQGSSSLNLVWTSI